MSVDIIVPPAGESVTEAEIANWNKKTGDAVQLDELVGEVETEKANLEIRSPAAGTLQLKKAVGDTVKIGEVIALVEEGANQPTPASSKPKSPQAVAPPSPAPPQQLEAATTPPPVKQPGATSAAILSQPTDRSFAPPSVRRLMREHSLSSAAVAPASPTGRLTKADIEKTLSNSLSTQTPPAAVPQSPLQNELPTPPARPQTKKKLSRLRKTIASRLVKAQQTSALLTTFNEIDMHAVMELRKTYKTAFKEKYEVGLGFMSFFAKAVVLALKEFPVVHSFIQAEEIVTPSYCDLGIAVATPKGLVVPVVRDAHQKAFSELEKAILTLAKKGRAGKLSLDELSGGTFSITNGGVFGSMLSTPIVNYPQAAILGMHNIVSRPFVVNDQILIRPIMYAALTYDHRLIDGAEAVQFLVRIKQLIEDPRRLLLAV